MSLLISCESGGDQTPAQLCAELAQAAPIRSAPAGHRNRSLQLPRTLAHDATARVVARRLAKHLSAPLIENPYSLELVDVTRSRRHCKLYSPLTRSWPVKLRGRLMELVYQPYRQQIRAAVSDRLKQWPYVIHLSIRSFASRFSGKIRRGDVGLLYDPACDDELDFCLDWIDEMYDAMPMLRVRRNYPRRGTSDSMTRTLRREFAGQNYLGVEVLLNRAWAGRPLAIRDEVVEGIGRSLQSVIAYDQREAA